jgi:hypothetical protein
MYYGAIYHNFWHIIFNVSTDARIKKMYYNVDVHTKKITLAVNEGLKTNFNMIIISRCRADLPRSNKNNFSDVSIIPEKSGQCQAFSNKRIENVRLSIIADGYGDLADEIIGDILPAGGEDA